MEVRRLELTLEDLLPVGRQAPGRRDDGIHVSTLVGELWEARGGLPDRPDPGKMTDDQATADALILAHRLEMGATFEETVASTVVRRLNRYSPMFADGPRMRRSFSLTLDGIVGTPDFLDYHTRCVWEVKFTWKSSRHPWSSPKYWGWFEQAKAYCYLKSALTGQLWPRTRLLLMFVCGSYAPPTPEVGGYEATFTWAELTDTWLMLLAHANDSGRMTDRDYARAVRAADRRLVL